MATTVVSRALSLAVVAGSAPFCIRSALLAACGDLLPWRVRSKECTHSLTAEQLVRPFQRVAPAPNSCTGRPHARLQPTAQKTRMQLRRVVVALALAAGTAFTLPTRRHAMQPLRAADEICGECDPMSPFSDGCRPCADGRSVFVGDTKVTSKTLRDIDVVSASGNRVRLDDLMGRKASVVVFLRHLG